MKMTLLVTSIYFSGLMAGLFYAWSMSVTLGLARLDDQSYLSAFKAMNRAILNPWLYIPLIGLALLLPLAIFTLRSSLNSTQMMSLIGATGLYLVGVMAVTMFGNVPLNDTLEALPIDKLTSGEMATFRAGYEGKWNNLNNVRSVCSSLVFLLLLLVYNTAEQV